MYTHWDYVVRGQGRGTHRMVYCPPLRPARKRDGRSGPWKSIRHRQEDKEETEVKRGTAPARTILPLHSKKAIIVMMLLPEWQHRRRQSSRKRPRAWAEQIGWISSARRVQPQVTCLRTWTPSITPASSRVGTKLAPNAAEDCAAEPHCGRLWAPREHSPTWAGGTPDWEWTRWTALAGGWPRGGAEGRRGSIDCR